jgi:geranylgeranyl diphosphate synthase type I
MDIYEKIVDYFSGIPCVDTWGEVQALFKRIGSMKPRHWMLPVRSCQAVGGTSDQAIPAAVAVACCHTSIILVDDMLDADPRGEYHRISMPAAANMACAFQAAGLEAIACSEAEPSAKMLALRSMNRMTLTTTLGQSWDVQCPADEAAFWRVVKTKSSPFFGAALEIGALLGRGPAEIAGRLNELGRLYGEMIQIHDDLNDALEVPANPDWTSGRSSLPLLFAQVVDHPDRQRFLELRKEASDPEKLAEAQTILIRCGAISYGVDQLVRRYQQSRTILDSIPLVKREELDSLLYEVINPVKKMFSALGMAQVSLPPSSVRLDAGISGGSNPT